MPYLLLSITIAYLAGAINFSILLFKILGKADPRKELRGNPGVVNVYRQAGFLVAALVWLLDMGRAIGIGMLSLQLVSIDLAPWSGLALILERIRRSAEGRDGAKSRLVRWFGPEESRTMVLFLPLLTGLAGLLTSFSRTGIAIGLFALGLTLAAAGRSSRVRTRLVIASMLLAAALVAPPALEVA